jgi:hypothetical protein
LEFRFIISRRRIEPECLFSQIEMQFEWLAGENSDGFDAARRLTFDEILRLKRMIDAALDERVKLRAAS